MSLMHLLLALRLFATPVSVPETPQLIITSQSPPTTGAAACSVTLRNVHSKAAVAWSLAAADGIRTTNDVLLTPELYLQPNATQTVVVGCPAEQSSPITVAVVQYEDGTVVGDFRAIRSIQNTRVERAHSLNELLTLIAGASAPDTGEEPWEAVQSAIMRASGPTIRGTTKGDARNALTHLRKAVSERQVTFGELRALVVEQLRHDVSTLQSFGKH